MRDDDIVDCVWEVFKENPDDEAVRAGMSEGLRALDPQMERWLLDNPEQISELFGSLKNNPAVREHFVFLKAVKDSGKWKQYKDRANCSRSE